MNAFKITLCFFSLCGFLAGCGRKLPPKPSEGTPITYPRPYPNPNLDEWSIEEECPPADECERYS
ncbi:MAG: hypothetical protein ACD_16C00205G0008 [uncultured bacterium]|nr:MAG: hypothetical protein ACD_16C00205G0008 [uncultured bacterium]HBG34872.1 hypothetical protein [Holosporales bacterium]HBW24870.1 hypothetical protein [Holosporales bacterium]HCC24527.1 hypothetical protein [Holosporales bacterium]HCE96258.1 hypothetical protein [Holosporales bacterium]